MDDPGLVGPTGQPINPGPEILLAKFENIAKMLAQGAALGEAAYKAAFEDIRRDLELHMMPAFYKLSKMDLVKPSQISAVTKGFAEAEKVVNRYYQVVGSQEEKQAAKARNTLKGQITDIEKYYSQLKEAAQKAAKTKEEELATTKKIDQERDKAISSHKKSFRLEETKELGSQLGSTLMGLGGIGSLYALANMISGVAQKQFALGSMAGRISGQVGTVAGTIGAGSATGAKALGGLTSVGIGGMTPEMQAEALGIVYSKAPQLASKNLEPIFTQLLNLGQNAAESAALVGQASADSGISVRGMVDNLELSRKIAQRFGQDTLVSMQRIMDFTKAIRTTGVDSETATKQARAWTVLVQDVGSRMNLGQTELSNFAAKFQSAISSMSPSHAAGLLLATTGRMPTSLESMGEQVAGPGFAKGVYDLISRGAGKQGQMFVPQAFGSMMGMGNVDIQTAKLIREAMQGGGTSLAELQKQGLQGDASNLRDARNKLVFMAGPMEVIANVMKQVVGMLLPRMADNLELMAHPYDQTLGKTGLDTVKEMLFGGGEAALAQAPRADKAAWARNKNQPIGGSSPDNFVVVKRS